MKNVKLPPKKLFAVFFNLPSVIAIVLLLTTSACDKNLMQELPSSERSAAARLSSEALLTTSYEIEEYSATQILSKIPAENKEKAFIEIAAQPRLARQRVEFKLFADGAYEMTTTPLQPTKTALLPPVLQKKPYESVLAHKTVVQNNVVRFFDKDGKETGSAKLKPSRFDALARKVLTSTALNKDEVVNEIIGHPLVNEKYILTLAREKNASIKVNGIVTEIKFDLEAFGIESNEAAENLRKYSVQHYDFANKRMLGEKLYDKNGDKLLYRSTIFYRPVKEGNQMEKILSESYHEDPKTGIKTRQIKQAYYTDMKVNLNI
ncbi:hypothetical protein [Dyadobacter chenhuakuii]|uniref:Uncharacterized protein n=1 Tax=Dyadobacter chenhuakuii TaxID=2909339 RepID=A0A9X1TTF5_9BACT|nr:hypothetical protein [Dyadobacter chenhuakuii]MCF2495411.1 hypothetical protein [Dyadobacter chenhuakuii]MCF2500124.1 hypothetical protein [Dyadobacter chenhuakuii]USJ29449.1 hypothetical protein NFI80_16370 [Dyadobacter chenhuakuii]